MRRGRSAELPDVVHLRDDAGNSGLARQTAPEPTVQVREPWPKTTRGRDWQGTVPRRLQREKPEARGSTAQRTPQVLYCWEVRGRGRNLGERSRGARVCPSFVLRNITPVAGGPWPVGVGVDGSLQPQASGSIRSWVWGRSALEPPPRRSERSMRSVLTLGRLTTGASL